MLGQMLRRVISLLFALATVAAVAGCGGGDDGGSDIVVSAASSLEEPLTVYAESIDGTVRQQFAGSDELAAQIRNGTKPDVYVSADVRYPQQLFEDGLVEKPEIIAGNRLVIAVPKGSEINFITDLEEPGVKVVTGDASVPVGIYTDDFLAKLPQAESAAITANVRSREPEVSSVVGKLTQGAADAGFVYQTDVDGADGELAAIPIPDDMQPRILYSAAVVKGSGNPDGAADYIDGLVNGPGATALHRAGFIIPL